MARKSRKKAQSESPATEPTAVAAVLERSPALQAIFDSRDAKSRIDSERQMPGPPEQAAVAEMPEPRVPASFAEAVKASKSAFGPIADGFANVDSFPAAGIKVNRSLDWKVAALQFAEDRLPTRAEKDILEAVGESGRNFVYKTARRQWERHDPESPGANLVDAKRVGADLAREREGLSR